LNAHFSRASDMVVADHTRSQPSVPITSYRDGFGNWCNRMLAASGRVTHPVFEPSVNVGSN